MIFNRKRVLVLLSALLTIAVVAVAAVWAAGNGNDSRSLGVGDRFEVVLEGNPTTGYSWEVTEIDEAIVVLVGEPSYASQGSGVGAGGEFTFGFQAVGPGDTEVKLVYHRPWEKDVEPISVHVVQVSVR